MDDIRLTVGEIHGAFTAGAMRATSAPVLSPGLFASLTSLPLNTVYSHLESGRFRGCHRRRGKHQLIWRDRALLTLFNGENSVLFASDWPHHDFDHPSKVLQIPLSNEVQRKIMGGNAMRLLNLEALIR